MSSNRVDSPHQLAARIDSLFSASSISEVDRLVSASDCAIALAAGWERVRRTMPKAKRQDVVSPSGLALSRFLGSGGRANTNSHPGGVGGGSEVN